MVEDEESMGGGSELSDVEDVFVGEEVESPRVIRCENRPSEEDVCEDPRQDALTRSQWVPPLRTRNV